MKNFSYMLLSFLFIIACQNDDNKESLKTLHIKIETLKDENIDLSNAVITIENARTETKTEHNTNQNGELNISILPGTYNISVICKDKDGEIYNGYRKGYRFIGENSVLIIQLTKNEVVNNTFVIDELYFDLDINYTKKIFYEQYFTIKNNSDKPLYLDGLSFGITAGANALELTQWQKIYNYLPNTIVLSQVYSFPGSGNEYLVEPGKSVVIAHSAQNHKEIFYAGEDNFIKDKPKSLDLTGADFEIYIEIPTLKTVADNPEVPNVIINYTSKGAFYWMTSGIEQLVLFRLDDVDTHIAENSELFEIPSIMNTGMTQNFVKIPASSVIDAIETSADGFLKHKVLPVSIDNSTISVPQRGGNIWNDGGYGGYLVKRKTLADGKSKDTNNSSNDVKSIKGGAKSYPKK